MPLTKDGAKAAAAFRIGSRPSESGPRGSRPYRSDEEFGLRYENREVRIDEALLSDIARTTHGRYFRARDANALQQIFQEFDHLERVPVRTRTYVRYAEQSRWPLGWAIGALMLELGLLAWRGPLT